MIENPSQIEDSSLQVTLEVPDHESLVELLEKISNLDLPVQTETITQAGLSADTSVTIELEMMTKKQLETLELALERGYYDRPRDADLEDLAADLDISKSAVSQRIRGAEIKLIKNALDRYQ
jgi:DNA-binding MarR family transcriptional regulator